MNAGSEPFEYTVPINENRHDEQQIISELSDAAIVKMEAIQSLLEPCDRLTYGIRLREAAEKLGKSKRTIQRLVKKWQEEGLNAIDSTERSDKGTFRINEQLEKFIVRTYQEGNKGSRRVTRKQVFIKTKAKAEELGVKPPSHMTVYRVLEPLIAEQDRNKSIRSPGWRGTQLSVKTRAGQDLSVEYSNHVWQCDHTLADILLVDKYGEIIGRPWLTTVVDTYSRCIMGINLGFDAPSSQVVALALRHAILPKTYTQGYQLHEEWGTYGKPQHFYTDGGKDFRSHHLQQISVELGFVCHLRDQMSKGTVAEIRDRMFRVLKGCQVEMLIIDEADRLKPKTFAEVRDIFDKLGIAVVLVGTDRLDAVIKRDEQVYNRFRACHRFGKLSGEDFEGAIAIWERDVLKLPVSSNLTAKNAMKVLAQATGGYIGLLDTILREAAIRSLKKGEAKIDLETLKEVAGEYK